MQGSKRDTDVKNRLLDYVGEGEGGMIWENSIETYLLPYVKSMTSTSSMHEACRALKAGALGQLRGMGAEGGGRGLRNGRHMHTLGWFMLMYGKNNHNIVR